MSSDAFVRSPSTTLARIQEAVDHGDDDRLLAAISDPQWLDDAGIHALLWHHPETLNRLLSVQDEYIQFASYRLLAAMLQSSTRLSNDPEILRKKQHGLIKELVRQLADSVCTSVQQKRAILELFHKLLKNQRHSPLQATTARAEDSDSAEDDDNDSDPHIASTVVRQLVSPLFWTGTFDHLLWDAQTQHATLVLFIDIEKARLAVRGSAEFENDIAECHNHVLDGLEQLFNSSSFQPFCIKKLYELFSLLLRLDSGLRKTDADMKAHLELAIRILTALSPLALQTLTTLMKNDPHLDRLSTAGTTFILPSSPLYDDVSQDLQRLLDNPEAIRQMGRVFMTGGQAVLNALLVSHRDSNLLAMECLTAELLQHSLRFAKTWIGPRSLKLLLRMYGEDDAGICWLLKAMSSIQRQLEELSTTLSPNPLLDELLGHLYTFVHPLEALFLFLESIGYDDQTLIDMLITIDDHDTGGLLAAIMAILRSFTEQAPDRLQRLVQRWHQELELEQEKADNNGRIDDGQEDDGNDSGSGTRLSLLGHTQRCLAQLASQIKLLDKRGLFPYNPRTLMVVLGRTQEVLSSVLGEITACG